MKPWYAKHFRKLRALSIWGIFFVLAYIFRSFFSLVFITFIITYSINSLLIRLQKTICWPRWGIVLAIYIAFGVLLISMGMIVFPRLYQESKSMTKEIPEAKDKLFVSFRSLLSDPDFSKLVDGSGVEESVRELISFLIQVITNFLQNFLRTGFHLLLSMVFSFLIIWDLDKLKADVQGLEFTKLGQVYRTIFPKLAEFGTVVGKAFEAQIVIACVNTILTLIGLTVLGIPGPLFLSVIVFFCSLIPVVGMIISSFPILLLGYKQAGVGMVFYSIAMIAVIHFIEAYILNPRIVGSHFSLHPFVAVCILVISETWFGVWGLILGAPVAVFVYQSLVLPSPEEVERNREKTLRKSSPQSLT